MKKLMLSAIVLFGLMFVYGLGYSQEKQTTGRVINKITKEPVQGVKVLEVKHGNSSYTDSTGHFSVALPKRSRELLFTHDDYLNFRHKFPPATPHKNLKILLTSVNHEKSDTLWSKQKNVISLSVFELFCGAVAIRYERFLRHQHSVGVHSSIYLFGRNPTTMGSEYDYYPKYRGIKMSPFYRFYPLRKKSFGLFTEGKIQLGYIHFSKLDYHYQNNTHPRVQVEQSFTSIGCGVSVGIMLKLPKTKHGVINLSIGYQYFPIDVPETIQYKISDETTLTLPTKTSWWDHGGPGTAFDFKFTIGGIF